MQVVARGFGSPRVVPQRPLAAWRSAAEAARLVPDAEAEKSLSSEELERLRALGYL